MIDQTLLLQAPGQPIDTWLDRVLHRRLSRPVSHLAVRLGLTPNQVSVASLVAGLAAAWVVAGATPGGALGGMALYLIAVVLDHADGEVARLTRRTSPVGAWLDVLVDMTVLAAMVAGMGLASSHLAGQGAMLGALAAMGVVASALVARIGAVAPGRLGDLIEALGYRDGFYLVLAGFSLAVSAAPAALPPLMGVLAAGSHTYWLARLASWCWRRSRARTPR